jgi:hypothetical protein
LAELTGIEPAISGVTGRHVNRYTTVPKETKIYNELVKQWWAMTGSNCRHPACKAGALPTELITHILSTDDIIHNFRAIVKDFFGLNFIKLYLQSKAFSL